MAITIDHLALPAHDNESSARFFAQVMGLRYKGPDRHFAPVQVNETFTLVFINSDRVDGCHLAFHIGEDDFEAILSHITVMGLSYGNDPRELDNMRTDHPFGGRGLFFVDLNGHLFEAMTKAEVR
jgi:catechol 2,3-dioxygenase-like lactoylglutathione lyase family enzyme